MPLQGRPPPLRCDACLSTCPWLCGSVSHPSGLPATPRTVCLPLAILAPSGLASSDYLWATSTLYYGFIETCLTYDALHASKMHSVSSNARLQSWNRLPSHDTRHAHSPLVSGAPARGAFLPRVGMGSGHPHLVGGWGGGPQRRAGQGVPCTEVDVHRSAPTLLGHSNRAACTGVARAGLYPGRRELGGGWRGHLGGFQVREP